MRTNAEFILFAVNQAKEAEAFGFTRNECCRNLKTALHQYWQNKTLGLHGQSQKARIPRSKAALNRPLAECVVEHVVPQMTVVNRLMEMEPLTTDAITEFLTSCFTVMLVTHDEHTRLNASGLRSTMPHDWDGADIFARYADVRIEAAPTLESGRRDHTNQIHHKAPESAESTRMNAIDQLAIQLKQLETALHQSGNNRIKFNQQPKTKGNMRFSGCNGSLYVQPAKGCYDISLQGIALTAEMSPELRALCGRDCDGYKQANQRNPYWRVEDFALVRAAVERYAKTKA